MGNNQLGNKTHKEVKNTTSMGYCTHYNIQRYILQLFGGFLLAPSK